MEKEEKETEKMKKRKKKFSAKTFNHPYPYCNSIYFWKEN